MSSEGYTVKERLEDLARTIAEQLTGIGVQLDKIDRKLDEKASNHRVRELEENLERYKGLVDARFKPLEEAAIGSAAVSKARRRVENALVAIAASAVGALVYLVVTGVPR